MYIKADFLTNPAVETIFDAFSKAGFQIFFVGGCVRNAVLGAPTSDLDLSTTATPTQMREIAKANSFKLIPTGEDHGTMTFLINDIPFEVTTFRKDVETDGRRAVVAFSTDMKDDALRRDFTMNALYADQTGLIYDPLGGLPDTLENKIKFIENPTDRIKEDYLRILRFFRFYAWYGSPSDGIDPDGFAACAELAGGLKHVSKERIGAEVLKILSANDPSPAVAAMDHAGVLQQILPGSDAKVLPILVHFEGEVLLDPLHRLAALGGENVADCLRLSKAHGRRVEDISKTARTFENLFEMGHSLGASDGLAALRIRAALLEQHVSPEDVRLVKAGAGATFPLKADDVIATFQGPKLGQALGRAKRHWLDESGAPAAKDLKDWLLQNG